MTAPSFSVVVPTVDRPELVAKCLDGILAGDVQDFEVIIVDQSRDDRTHRVVEERTRGDSRVRYFHAEATGAARARNFGAARARGEIVVFIDDDAIPAKGWLGGYADAFREVKPQPGMVAGRTLLAWEGTLPEWYPLRFMFLLSGYDAGDEVREFPPGDFPISANLALPRALMEELGGFDSELGFDVSRRNPLLGGEDSHLALKVMNAGRSVYYHPRAEVRHLVRAVKLTRRYLIQRVYWHGRTYVQLRARRDGERRSWMQVLRDSRRKRAASGGRAASAARPSSRSSMVHALALSAFALGVVAEAISIRVDPPRGAA